MSSLSVCVCVCVGVFVLVCVGPVHVEGGLGIGFNLPIPRSYQIETPFPAGGVCGYTKLGAPKSTLYYGKNQIVVRLREFTPNNFLQLKLYGYVPTNQTSTSTAGPYLGIAWSYESDSSARLVATVYNVTSPAALPQGAVLWDTVMEIDIPQGITCTPHCTAQLVGTTVSPSGSLLSAVSCSDVVLMERRPTPIYLTLRPDGCCPLEPVTIGRRLYEMFGSNTSMNPFAATSYPLWDYISQMTWIVSNVWYIDATAPNTFKINPQTGYYSVKIVIHDQYNQTAQQIITTLTNTQLVSSALSPDSRGANNSYVWWGDAPNTYPGGAGRSMNAASPSASASASISISIIATAMSALIIASFKHI